MDEPGNAETFENLDEKTKAVFTSIFTLGYNTRLIDTPMHLMPVALPAAEEVERRAKEVLGRLNWTGVRAYRE